MRVTVGMAGLALLGVLMLLWGYAAGCERPRAPGLWLARGLVVGGVLAGAQLLLLAPSRLVALVPFGAWALLGVAAEVASLLHRPRRQ